MTLTSQNILPLTFIQRDSGYEFTVKKVYDNLSLDYVSVVLIHNEKPIHTITLRLTHLQTQIDTYNGAWEIKK